MLCIYSPDVKFLQQQPSLRNLTMSKNSMEKLLLLLLFRAVIYKACHNFHKKIRFILCTYHSARELKVYHKDFWPSRQNFVCTAPSKSLPTHHDHHHVEIWLKDEKWRRRFTRIDGLISSHNSATLRMAERILSGNFSTPFKFVANLRLFTFINRV